MNVTSATPPIALDRFIAQLGIGPTTAWRYRKKGWLRTVNISGRHYVPHDAAVEFNQRAERGEFAAPLKNPSAERKHGRN